MQMFNKFFGNNIISQNVWPPQSPDLTPLDFSFFGVLKDNVHKNIPHMLKELKQKILRYSGTSIYRSRIDRFPASTIRHFWSPINFHINNVIYSRFHRSPNYRFRAFIVYKSPSRHSISRMDRLKKKWKRNICVTFSLDYKFGNTVKQPRDLQLHVSDISISFH